MSVYFAQTLIVWQQAHGRHHLPWQVSDPYSIWLSEIMLQQTQVETVIPYYQRFMTAFPSVQALAAASVDEVMALWSGLGYYARARHLHQAAQQIVSRFQGTFPRTPAELETLPGIGRSTAAAIAAFAFGYRAAILDGNVKRVLCRVFGMSGWPGERAVTQKLWDLAESLLPPQNIGSYTQALMDFGALLCTRSRPRCPHCPLQTQCIAYQQQQTHLLPTPRPKKVLPQRTVQVLVIQHQKQVLLQRRPPLGIWGGLLSLPEVPSHQTAKEFAGTYADHPPQHFVSLEHTFTHFRLTLEAWRLSDVPAPAAQFVAESDTALTWWSLDDLDQAGLPTPIRKILRLID